MDNLIRYYRRDSTPYPPGRKGLFEWARDMETMDRRIALDALPNGVEVSTLWLGLDHKYSFRRGRPLIFETMLFVKIKPRRTSFGVYGREEIGEQWRYATEEEALRGHKMLVKKWSKFKTADQVLLSKEVT